MEGARITVGIAELKVATTPDILVTYGLGSCVGIVIYDEEVKMAALAHTLLPKSYSHDVPSPKFSDAAVEMMVGKLVAAGCGRGRLQAKVAGGAHMFDSVFTSSLGTIGQRNVAAVRESLQFHGIPLVAEETGGTIGRTIEFHTATSRLHVRTLQKHKVLI